MAEQLGVVEVQAEPALTFTVDRAPGPMLATVHSGTCLVGRSSQPLIGGRRPVRLGFYVTGCGPIRPSHLVESWVEMSLAWVEHVSANTGGRQRYGVDDPQVQLVDDQRGSGSLWPYIWFTALGGTPMLVRYRLTVLRPAG
jgi:hypothetical protein